MSEIFPEDNDRCTDPVDEGCKTETRMREASVAVIRHRAKPEQEPTVIEGEEGEAILVWSITECVDCDDDIPAARLALGKIRCVACQDSKEKKEKQYAR